MKSNEIGDLAKALAAVQGAMKPAPMNKVNPFFKSKYADLAAIIESSRSLLVKNGLAITQTVEMDSDTSKDLLVTTLMHSSGQWIEGRQRLNPAKDDPQGLGSALTYARRYGYSALIGQVADPDDDGNAATQAPKPNAKKPAEKAGPVDEVPFGKTKGSKFAERSTEHLNQMLDWMKDKEKYPEHQIFIKDVLADRKAAE